MSSKVLLQNLLAYGQMTSYYVHCLETPQPPQKGKKFPNGVQRDSTAGKDFPCMLPAWIQSPMITQMRTSMIWVVISKSPHNLNCNQIGYSSQMISQGVTNHTAERVKGQGHITFISPDHLKGLFSPVLRTLLPHLPACLVHSNLNG